MVVVAILLILIGAALVLAGLFTSGVSATGDLELLGIEVSGPSLFLLGVLAAVLVILGLWTLKYGAQREWRQRREQRHDRKQYDQLGERLRREDGDRFDDEDGR